MKMAKASEADINMAMTMANILDDIERGYFPSKLASDPESEESEWLETASCEQYERLIDGLKRVLNLSSIFRVIWGMAVVCDPSNELLDPTSNVLAVHPKLKLALEQRDVLGTQAAKDVIAERQRQQSIEGWIPEHDDQYKSGEMSRAAGLYAISAGFASKYLEGESKTCPVPDGWPWANEWWKPTNSRRDLVKAAALIIAEIERIDRAAIVRVKGGS